MNNRAAQLKRVARIRLLIFFIILLGALSLVIWVDNLLVSLVLAFVTNYLLGPWVNALERSGIPRGLATVIVFAVTTAVFLAAAQGAVPVVADQLLKLQGDIPNSIQGLSRFLTTIEERLQFLNGAYLNLDFANRLQSLATGWATGFFNSLPSTLSQILTIAFLTPLIAFFMIRDGRAISRGLLSLVPNHIFEVALTLHHKINEQLGQFVRARLLESLIVSLMIWVGLLFLQFPYAFLLAAIAGVANLIPYIGPFIGAIPALLLVLADGGGLFVTASVAAVYLTAQVVDIVFIIPLVVARVVNLHPVVVVIAILVGAQLFGVMGMLISIPVVSVLKLTTQTLSQYLLEH